jgi:hypothetical protein
MTMSDRCSSECSTGDRRQPIARQISLSEQERKVSNVKGRDRVATLWMASLAATLLILAPACSEEKSKDDVREVAGTVESIDPDKKIVKVRTYLEKRERYQPFPVLVTDDTEILINGALARLEDVRVGEQAEGTIRIVRDDNSMRFIALKVRIRRSEVIEAPGADADGKADDSATKDKAAEDKTGGQTTDADSGGSE